MAPVDAPSTGEFTASPTDAGSVAINLEPFSILYETETSRQASRDELVEVTDATRLYLEDFMFDEFSQSSFTFLDDFITRLVTSTFVPGAPYVIDYSSTARFNPFSTVFPGKEQLDEALVIAFTGANLEEYTRRLEGLSADNVFRGAEVYFGNQVVQMPRETGGNGAAIAAGAIAATLLAAGVIIYKRRSFSEEMEGKDLNKGHGDATVAGETFTGETHDGSASVGAGSFDNISRYRDDEDDDEGTKSHQSLLDTIKEDVDDDSVRPRWGNNTSYDEECDVGTQDVSPSVGNATMDRTFPEIRRVATEGSSVVSSNYSSGGGISAAHSFDEMALQGLAHTSQNNQMPDVDETSRKGGYKWKEPTSRDEPARTDTPEVASLLSHDSMDDESVARSVISSDSTMASTSKRPRTVAEIEAILSADTNETDEESQVVASRSRSFGNESASTVTPSRPRTVEEIESLLSAGLDEDDD